MPIRYLHCGRLVEVDLRAEVLGVARAEDTGERVVIERWTAIEQLSRLILEHQNHQTLLRNDDPLRRLLGLHCACTEPPFDIQMPISLVVVSTQEVRAVFHRLGAAVPSRVVPSKKDRLLRLRAEKRARDLLHQFLTPEQRWSLRANGSFRVQGQDGKTYLVRQGQTVQLLEGGAPVTSYCIHPREPMPALDVMLAQKLLLEHDIEHFLANANASPAGSFREQIADAVAVGLAANR